MNNISPLSQRVPTRLPQVSVLGPLPFSLYLIDLPQVLNSEEILMYADDTVIPADSLYNLEARANFELAKKFKMVFR